MIGLYVNSKTYASSRTCNEFRIVLYSVRHVVGLVPSCEAQAGVLGVAKEWSKMSMKVVGWCRLALEYCVYTRGENLLSTPQILTYTHLLILHWAGNA